MKKYIKDIKEALFSTLIIAGSFIAGSSIVRSFVNGELTLRDDNLFVFIIAFAISVVYQVVTVRKRRAFTD